MKELVIKVQGMVCNGCENRVKNALETLQEVQEVVADYTNDTVKITLKQEIQTSVLKEKIEDIGFEVKEN